MENTSVIGMDMGDKNHKAVVLGVDGIELERSEVACTPEAVGAFLSRHPGALLAVETGTHCRWVSRVGIAAGHEVLVGNARKLRLIWASSRKNDWRDAEMIAKLARTDRSLFHPVALRDAAHQRLMRLVKARAVLVRSRAAVVNQIRGFCKSEGARLRKCSSETFVNLLGEIPAELAEILRPLSGVLAELSVRIKQYDRLIERTMRREHGKATELFAGLPGVGPVTAAAFVASIGDAETFGDPRQAGAYFGLVPRQDQSGQGDKQLRISKEGDETVRRLLVTAANYIMGPFGRDSDLRRHGERIAARGGKNARKRAKVAVARKLAVIMTVMLRDACPYRPFAESKEAVTA